MEIDNWTFEELKEAVVLFKFKFSPQKSEEMEEDQFQV